MEATDNKETPQFKPQVKICGLTRIDQALACAELGADAIGLVFYSKSPRYVSTDQARSITDALPPQIKTVGVFVNETVDHIKQTAARCGLQAVQLHGQEGPAAVAALIDAGLMVIKALFQTREPDFAAAADYPASAFLVECGQGPLPGGNAMAWRWDAAREVSDNRPLILAGGLAANNVVAAALAGDADAVDVSSGVELRPGEKDTVRVKQFLEAVGSIQYTKPARRVFL